MREALDLGGELFDWEQKKQLSGQRNGTKVTGVGMGLSPFTAGSTGRDGLMVIRPDGKLYVHQGIGNLGTHSIADTARPAADVLDLSWDQVVIVWGDTSKHLPFSTVQAGSQTTHAHTRANHAAATAMVGLLKELAARELGGSPGSYRVADGRVFRAGNRRAGMSFAEAARVAMEVGGKFSGHEFPEDLNNATKAAVAGLAGEGLIAAARDNYDRAGAVYTWVATFAQVELDVETGEVEIIDLASTTDCGHGHAPAQPGGPDQRRRLPGHRDGEGPALGLRSQVGHPLHQALLHGPPARHPRRTAEPALRRRR